MITKDINIIGRGKVLIDHTAYPDDYKIGQEVEYNGVMYTIKEIEYSMTLMGNPEPKKGVGLIV